MYPFNLNYNQFAEYADSTKTKCPITGEDTTLGEFHVWLCEAYQVGEMDEIEARDLMNEAEDIAEKLTIQAIHDKVKDSEHIQLLVDNFKIKGGAYLDYLAGDTSIINAINIAKNRHENTRYDAYLKRYGRDVAREMITI